VRAGLGAYYWNIGRSCGIQDYFRVGGRLLGVVREGLYYWFRSETFKPDLEYWEESVKDAVEDEMLEPTRSVEDGFDVDRDRPAVAKAMDSIESLREFLEEKSSRAFKNDFDQHYGDTPSLGRKSMWYKLTEG
jgi:hypothetical protein